jgi:excisionase family DNA binding protein
VKGGPKISKGKPQMARYVPIKEAAERYSVTWWTIREWIDVGKITGYRLGDRLIRVDLDEIDGLLKPIPTVKID